MLVSASPGFYRRYGAGLHVKCTHYPQNLLQAFFVVFKFFKKANISQTRIKKTILQYIK